MAAARSQSRAGCGALLGSAPRARSMVLGYEHVTLSKSRDCVWPTTAASRTYLAHRYTSHPQRPPSTVCEARAIKRLFQPAMMHVEDARSFRNIGQVEHPGG